MFPGDVSSGLRDFVVDATAVASVFLPAQR
jgi:hypothetical protein